MVVLPVPGRAPEDHRPQRVGLDQRAQRRARREQVVLADDLVEGPRPEPERQRRLRRQPGGSGGGEQVLGDPGTLPAPLELAVVARRPRRCHCADSESGQAFGGRKRRPSSASWRSSTGVGRAGHRVDARLRLREGDDLADVLLAGEDGDEPVDAEGEAAVGRGAVAERAGGRTRSGGRPPPR